MTESNDAGSQARVEFCGETYPLDPTRNFVIGREGDLVIDSNPFLHRRFLELTFADNLWWLGNIGSQLQVTAADGTGSMHAWLSPGAKIPLPFSRLAVWFTAAPQPTSSRFCSARHLTRPWQVPHKVPPTARPP